MRRRVALLLVVVLAGAVPAVAHAADLVGTDGAGEDDDEEEGDATTHLPQDGGPTRVRAALSRSPHGA